MTSSPNGVSSDYGWLVFGLIKQDETGDFTCRVPKCTIVYKRNDVFCAMRFECPYWIRVEGIGWGMLVTMYSHGIICRAIRGDRDAAERDLFMLRMQLPKY